MQGKIVIGLMGAVLNLFEKKLLLSPVIAGIILFARNFKNKTQISLLITSFQDLREKHNLPRIIVFIDHEGGFVQRLKGDGFTILPSASDVGCLFQKDAEGGLVLIQDIARVTAIELGSIGIDVVLGPVLDIAPRKKRNLRDTRFYGTDPSMIQQLASAYIQELQKYGLIAVPKHFPGTGSNNIDSHFRISLSDLSLEDMQSKDLLPYQQLMTNGNLKALMLSHSVYWKVDESPINSSSLWLKDILRKKMGFSGGVITDCIQMLGVKNYRHALPDKIIKALHSGCDLVLCSQIEPSTYKELYAVLNHISIKDVVSSASKFISQLSEKKSHFRSDFFNDVEYIDSKRRIEKHIENNKPVKKIILKATRTSVIYKIFSKYEVTAKQWLLYLIVLDYYARLMWYKLKNFTNSLIRK